MNYDETSQKLILREAARGFLALLVIDARSGEYEVLYTDGAMREFGNRYQGEDFFESAWPNLGLAWVYEEDRPAVMRDFTMDNILRALERDDGYACECRLIVGDAPTACRIKASWNPIEEGTITLLFQARNIAEKSVYIRMFGRFTVMRGDAVVNLRGKAKEILALVVSRRGREVGNGEIYETIWEGRPYSNENMTVYYNALRRLRRSLADEGLEQLLISTPHGQMANTELFDCDYYDWLDGKVDPRSAFEGEFLSEYPWGETMLAELMRKTRE